jgi:predicted Rossmann-fold nucleotide-binding protein
MLVKYSHGFVAGPGGLGTFDEVFAAATLVHTGKIENFPIVLLGRDFWDPIVTFLDSQVGDGQMADCTPSHFFVTDSPADAVDHICHTVPGSHGVAERNVPHWPAADAPR